MKMQAFPLHALICLVSVADAFKILFFWSVDSDKRTQDMVKANINYAKSQGGADCCDVMLSHYSGKPADWDQEWYSQHVVQNRVGGGYKYKALRELYNMKNECGSWETQYEWVWAMDADIDITGTDLNRFFSLARESNSLIISPTFKGPPGQWVAFNSLLEAADTDSTKHQINVIGKPDDKCKFRHSTYVEMTCPLVHGLALSSLFEAGKCDHCIGDNAEWGLDRVWCSIVKRSVGGVDQSCAYLDETPILHLDWKTAQVNNAFHDTEVDVRNHHPDDYQPIKAVDCIPK